MVWECERLGYKESKTICTPMLRESDYWREKEGALAWLNRMAKGALASVRPGKGPMIPQLLDLDIY